MSRVSFMSHGKRVTFFTKDRKSKRRRGRAQSAKRGRRSTRRPKRGFIII